MLIVSDTTPLHYLILLDKAEILRLLFGEIIIPEAVFEELLHAKTPAKVKTRMAAAPSWIIVKKPTLITVSELGKGESEAISLALEIQADVLLFDDRKAVREARRHNLLVITTLGLLELAAIKRLIKLPQVLHELFQANFRMPSADIIADFLRRDAERNLQREANDE